MKKNILHLWGLLLAILLTGLSAEQVGKLTYKGIPENLNDSTINAPSDAVFMSETVTISSSTEFKEIAIDTANPPSIFFVIDHSGSMYLKSFTQDGTPQTARDRMGARFRVTSDLIDTIKAKHPGAEVGFTVFGTNLYFDPKDDRLFNDFTWDLMNGGTWDLDKDEYGSSISSGNITGGIEFDVKIKGQTADMKNKDQWPWASASTYFAQDVNLVGVTDVVIEYQCSGANLVMTLPQEPLSEDGEEYQTVLQQSNVWKKVTVPIASFKQPDWVSSTTPYDPSKVNSISLFPEVTNAGVGVTANIKVKSIVLLKEDTYYTGGYIPLMKLRDNYEYLNKTKNGTGFDILKHYLDTATSDAAHTSNAGQTYLNLKYIPSDTELEDRGTNITAAFDAVKDAFKSASAKPDRQFVIFLSDGEPSMPMDNTVEMMRFLEDDQLPTLFTVFFSPQGVIPKPINDLTKLVKESNYSKSNDKSAAWSINADYETLMKTLVDNVLSIINTTAESKPVDITINGKKPDGKAIEKDGKYFYNFSSTFPFTDVINEFDYDIKYVLEWPDPDDTTKTIEEEVDASSNFTIALKDPANLPNDFEMAYWDRDIEFYYEGAKIDKANETMDSIEIRFVSSKIDTLYTYNNVKLDLTNSFPKISGDEDFERVSLKKVGAYSSVMVALQVEETNKGDKALQLNNEDEIIVTFRNPALPLDTLIDTLPFGLSGIITMESAAFFDKIGPGDEPGADGFIDSIYIALSSEVPFEIDSEDLDQLIENIELPSHRNFTILDTSVTATGIALNVRENVSHCNTAVDEERDSISLSHIILEHGGWVESATVLAEDRMAPVIMSAEVYQYEDESLVDTLRVQFSEPVKNIHHDEPFLFMDPTSGSEFQVTVSRLSSDKEGSRCLFSIDEITGKKVIEKGDSIWINYTYGNKKFITDSTSFFNKQDASNNIRRELHDVTYERIPIVMIGATFFDKIGPGDEPGADGFIDSIFIELTAGDDLEVYKDDLDQLIENLQLPAHRELSIIDTVLTAEGISLTVKENASRCNTAVDEERDSVSISNVTLESGGWVQTAAVLPEDRMAPVIVSARVHQFEVDSLVDTLTVAFSEPVKEAHYDEPFLFMNPNAGWLGESYRVFVSYLEEREEGQTQLFTIDSIDGQKIIHERDSIWINHDYGNGYYITDTTKLRNEQSAENNIHRPFDRVIYEEKPFILDVKAVGPVNFKNPDKRSVIPSVVIDALNEENLNALHISEEDGDYHGMIIVGFEKEKSDGKADITMTGEIEIVDHIGNVICEKKEMSFSKDQNSIYYVWNGKNSLNRVVGGAAYLALIHIKVVSETSGNTISDRVYKRFLMAKN